MEQWLHILAEIGAFLAYAWIQYRQQRGLERKIPEIISSSLRPPKPEEDDTPVTCAHESRGCLITDRFMWCSRCGALKIDGSPWRQAR